VIHRRRKKLEPGERVRLLGVELHGPLGPAAAEFVHGLVEGRRVRLSYDPATVLSGHRDPRGSAQRATAV
jgi:YD repeat-containing protein